MPEHKELGVLKGAYSSGILYIPATYAEMQMDEMAKARTGTDQVTFQQVSSRVRLEIRWWTYSVLC